MDNIPEVRTLSEKLPKGAGSGRLFAKAIDLLLVNEARLNSQVATVFDDRAGDYFGLDSFVSGFRQIAATGYQYKFYPSPLTSSHKRNIVASIEAIARNQRTLALEKLCIVTPDDLMEQGASAQGDLSWWEALVKRTIPKEPHPASLPFALEHVGHKKIIEWMLRAPHVSVFYYPELTREGRSRRKRLEDTKALYVANVAAGSRNIEFVGTSVYKQETGRGIPLQDIYIPVDIAPFEVPQSSRLDPLKVLTLPGNHVVLGDPGSGKSTLLRFLSVAGHVSSLRERYHTVEDDRLPIVVSLRGYGQALESDPHLSLLEYMARTTSADYALPSADEGFFLAYLETRQSMALFDGLDELGQGHVRSAVINRIKHFSTTYAGNTVVVSSRIVGYDYPYRLSPDHFNHFQVCDLTTAQMTRFVSDWYTARVDNPAERRESILDLTSLLTDEDHAAIADLARNPLLLTIVALVHRIDAVLPDERVVLYQKCTETLLNTWHTWKYRGSLGNIRGRSEKRNRYRLEAIANWMHRQGGSTESRAIANEDALLDFLTTYIQSAEVAEAGENAEETARTFLEFIRDRTGLLIEVGSNRYSFVHLTFQEYLTAAYIKDAGDRGIDSIWLDVSQRISDSRWHEVLRLLIAELREPDQEVMIGRILEAEREAPKAELALLLLGLLTDGIPAADIKASLILRELIHRAADCETPTQMMTLLLPADKLQRKDARLSGSLQAICREIFSNDRASVPLLLLAAALGCGTEDAASDRPQFRDPWNGLVYDRVFRASRDRLGGAGPLFNKLGTELLVATLERSTTQMMAMSFLPLMYLIDAQETYRAFCDMLLATCLDESGDAYASFLPNAVALYLGDPDILEELDTQRKLHTIYVPPFRGLGTNSRSRSFRDIVMQASRAAPAARWSVGRVFVSPVDARGRDQTVSERELTAVTLPEDRVTTREGSFLPAGRAVLEPNLISPFVQAMSLEPVSHWSVAFALFSERLPLGPHFLSKPPQTQEHAAAKLLINYCTKRQYNVSLYSEAEMEPLISVGMRANVFLPLAIAAEATTLRRDKTIMTRLSSLLGSWIRSRFPVSDK